MGYKNIKFDDDDVFLITGCAGFIGSNLAEYLLKSGYKVRGLDNMSNGLSSNIELLKKYSNFDFIEGDIIDMETCLMATKGVTYVSHQAAWGSVPRSIKMPLFYQEVNIKGTLNMLEASKVNNIKKFVYASSSSVYGDEPNLPKFEGREGNLLSPYALTKKTNEEYGKLYYSLYGLETFGLRYFNVFGRRQNPRGDYAAVLPKFISQIREGESLVINGDGYQSRDFTYIENVIEANIRCFIAPSSAAGKCYNIAYGGQVNLLSVVEILFKLIGKKVPVMHIQQRQGDIKHSNADISRAKELLLYEPEYSFEDGIKEYLEWFDNEN